MDNGLKVVCFKYKDKNPMKYRYREEYTQEHVRVFRNMINRNLTIPHEIVCITDDVENVPGGVRPIKMWEDFIDYGGCFVRLRLFSEEMKDIIGDSFVNMDLDVVITDNIDDLFTNIKSDYKAWERRNPTPYCGSMFYMRSGARSQVWENFHEKDLVYMEKKYKSHWINRHALNAGFHVGTDQSWISYNLYPNEESWTKEDGVYNFQDLYKRSENTLIPDNCKIMFFAGRCDPSHEELQTRYPWILENWQ